MISSGIGALLRQITNQFMKHLFKVNFPLATLFVNIIGSFVIGISAHYLSISSDVYAIIVLGLCGGYTTFSTHILDVYEMHVRHSYKRLIIYVSLTIVLSISACYIGYHI
ncbi:fluoride efflux transporter FluC [Mammaliicoccus stepanovicii]|nr:CrcB family protein [Mammaliicoccus stepanovicii]